VNPFLEIKNILSRKMGSKSCKVSGDGIKVNSPVFGCLLDHCDCNCIQDEPRIKEPPVPSPVPGERGGVADPATQIEHALDKTLKELFGVEVCTATQNVITN
jgi:hypothetical protein